MKTETQIAEEKLKGCGSYNIEPYPLEKTQINSTKIYCGSPELSKRLCENCKKECIEHKSTCQRTREKWIGLFNLLKEKGELKTWVNAYIMVEIDDNHKAIKLYEDAGI